MKRRKSRTQARILRAGEYRVSREARYISACAAAGDSRLVTIGPLLLFSTGTRDAWMLDPANGLALCLARDGSSLPFTIEESEARFTVKWTHTYRITGEAMTFADPRGDLKTILGYPTHEIEKAIRRIERLGL